MRLSGCVVQVSVIDEMERWTVRQLLGGVSEGVEEGREFDFAGGAEARDDVVKVRIVVAGMTDEFPQAIGHGLEDCCEGSGVEIAGGGDAEGAIRGEDTAALDLG